MTAPEIKKASWLDILENIEKVIFYTSLLIIPISVIPLPWDITEYSMGISLIFFSSFILTIEFIKLVIKGRLLLPKATVDTSLLLFLVSILFSTVFSTSLNTSLWGFDFRLGSGAVLTVLVFIYLYVVRSFLFNFEDIQNGFKFLMIGTFITALFSIFSFFGMNVLSFSDFFRNLFTVGLPAYSSSKISSIIWSISFLISLYFTAESFKNKKIPFSVFSIFSMIATLLAITLYTLATGWEIFLTLTIATVFLTVWIGIKNKGNAFKAFNMVMIVSSVIISLFFLLSRIPVIRNGIGSLSPTLITQITISNDVSLKVVTQSLSQGITQALFGIGHDAFSIGYNQFKPLDSEAIIINSTNFTNANNQIFNILTTSGIVGISIFVFLGYSIFKYLYTNFKVNKLDNEESIYLLFLDVFILFLFISNLFIYQTFLLTFLFVLSISSSIALRNLHFKDKLEVYVINWGIFSHSTGASGMKNITIGTIIFINLLGLLGLIQTGRLALSSYYVLKSENITAQGREKTKDEKLGEEEKSQILVDSINLYSKGINLNNGNDVLHRRAAIILSQYLESLASVYNKTDEPTAKQKLFDQIATYVEISVEESKRATDLAPKVYANWGVRSSVYSKLVGLGLNSYTKSALSALQTAASLNPLNYEIYYNAAQLYILNNETDNALRTLNQLFAINPNHIPSLILAGEISYKDKDLKQAQRYFQDAKKVMEGTNSTANEIYDYVSKKLGEITPQIQTNDTSKIENNEGNEVQK